MKSTQITMLQQREISEVLTGFGLGTREQDAYIALLQHGKTTMTPLARALNLPATTVQSVLSRLERIGLVDVTKQKSRSVFEAHDPVVLRRILEHKIQDVAGIIPLLSALKGESRAPTKIRVFTHDRIAEVLNASLRCKTKTVYEVVSADDFQESIGEKFHYTRKRVAEGIRLQSLRVEKYEIKKYNKSVHARELREAKFLPAELTFRSSILFWDDTVAFFTPREEGMCWTVESPAIHEMCSQIFALLWSVSRRMETLGEDTAG